MTLNIPVPLLLVLAFALSSACGGGGGGGTSKPPVNADPPPDVTRPLLFVDFPPPISLVDEISTPATTVRGRASDETDLKEVRVNGVAVEAIDDAGNWRIDVPLSLGTNAITVTAVDAAGNEQGKTVSVYQVPYIPQSPVVLAADPDDARIYVSDTGRGAIYSVDAASGEISLLSGAGKGSGPQLVFPRDIAVDAEGDRLIVVDSLGSGVLAVSTVDGTRTILSARTGADGFQPSGLALDGTGRAYVAEPLRRRIMEVDLATGERRVVSFADTAIEDGDDSVGAGDAFIAPTDLVHDAANGRLLVMDANARRVIAVDIASGDRTSFANVARPASCLELDAGGNRLLFGEDAFTGAVHQIDLDTREQTLVSGSTRGGGDDMFYVGCVSVPDDGGRSYALDRLRHRVVAVQLENGDREVLPSPGIGSGTDIVSILTLDFAPLSGRLLAGHRRTPGLMDVLMLDPADGARSLEVSDLPSATIGAVLDEANQSLLSLSGSALYAIDLVADESRVISGSATGNGPAFGTALAGLDASFQDRVAVVVDTEQDALFSVNLDDGAREIVSSVERGVGAAFDLPTAVVLAPDGAQAFVGESFAPTASRKAVYRVDIATGDRAVLAEIDNDPAALALLNDELLVLTTRALEAIDPESGERRLLSGGQSEPVGRGLLGHLGWSPADMSCDAERQVCYIAARLPTGVLAIDLVSGDRVLIAR